MKREKMRGEKHCKTAEELFRELDPVHGELWRLNRLSLFDERAWIFRGVWDATLPLTPAAFRKGAFSDFQFPGNPFEMTTAAMQRDWEDTAVNRFCGEADQLGFHVPSDRPELRDPRKAPRNYDPHRFPAIEKLHMYAFAQHYRVPTRLLDWTRRPLVAAYFAVEQFTRLEAPVDKDHLCVVWALDEGFVQNLAKRAVRRDAKGSSQAKRATNPDVFFITAPTVSNPNLAAQAGVFTLVQPRLGDPHPIPDVDEAVEMLARRVPKQWTNSAPFLWRFTLPANETRRALRLLAAKGIHAGTIYPGLASIREMFRERRHHHRVAVAPQADGAKKQSPP